MNTNLSARIVIQNCCIVTQVINCSSCYTEVPLKDLECLGWWIFSINIILLSTRLWHVTGIMDNGSLKTPSNSEYCAVFVCSVYMIHKIKFGNEKCANFVVDTLFFFSEGTMQFTSNLGRFFFFFFTCLFVFFVILFLLFFFSNALSRV